MFPTSPLEKNDYGGATWYQSFKNDCGFNDDCAYDIPSLQKSATAVAALIEHEKKLVGGKASNVFLGGFSQGSQMTAYMQLAKLDYALGGVIVYNGYPLPPTVHITKENTTLA